MDTNNYVGNNIYPIELFLEMYKTCWCMIATSWLKVDAFIDLCIDHVMSIDIIKTELTSDKFYLDGTVYE